MATLFDLPDLPPREAVAVAAEQAGTAPAAWEALDRALRGGVVRWLQEREGDPDELARALYDAGRAAGAPWLERWFTLLEVLRDGRAHPSAAEQVSLATDQWGARVLRAVAELPVGERKRVKACLGMDENHLTNVLRKLEDAGLLTRSRAGRETTLLLTHAGARLAETLGARVAHPDVPVVRPSQWRISAEPILVE